MAKVIKLRSNFPSNFRPESSMYSGSSLCLRVNNENKTIKSPPNSRRNRSEHWKGGMGKPDWFIPEGVPIIKAAYTKQALAVYALPKLVCFLNLLWFTEAATVRRIRKGETSPLRRLLLLAFWRSKRLTRRVGAEAHKRITRRSRQAT